MNPANNSATTTITVGAPPANTGADVLTSVFPPPSAQAGSAVTVPVTFANVGTASAAITGYVLQLPPGLTGVGCTGAGVGCSYDAGSGVVALSGLPGTLGSGQSVGFSLTYRAPAAGTPVLVRSAITTSTFEANTANNDASGNTTTVGAGNKPDVLATVASPTTATPGATVTVPVRFGNAGDVPAAGLSHTLTLAPGLTGVTCTAPVTCSYDGNSGVVTVSGLPVTLAAGEFTDLTLRYQAPASGVVAVTARIATGTPGETNVDNNSATARTTVTATSGGADLVITLGVPAGAVPNSTVEVPITLTNRGPLAATGVSYTLNLPPGLANVACTPAGTVTCSYNPASGTVTLSGLPGSLAPSQSIAFSLSFTAPTGLQQLPISATIGSGTFDPDNGNNTASGTTRIGGNPAAADLATTVTVPASALPGSIVTVPVRSSNDGTVPAAGVTYMIALSGAPAGVSISNGGVACSYDTGTGAVTGCGLPGTLAPGQLVNLVVSFTAPASGAVSVTSRIATSTGESSTANNSASGSVAITAVAAPVQPIPTLSEWALLALTGLLALFGMGRVRRQRR